MYISNIQKKKTTREYDVVEIFPRQKLDEMANILSDCGCVPLKGITSEGIGWSIDKRGLCGGVWVMWGVH